MIYNREKINTEGKIGEYSISSIGNARIVIYGLDLSDEADKYCIDFFEQDRELIAEISDNKIFEMYAIEDDIDNYINCESKLLDSNYNVIADVTEREFVVKDILKMDIKEATLTLQPPNVKKKLDKEQINELEKLLSEVHPYNRDDSYKEYVGQTATFDIIGTSGISYSLSIVAPYVVIDGEGYHVEGIIDEELNDFANKIVK